MESLAPHVHTIFSGKRQGDNRKQTTCHGGGMDVFFLAKPSHQEKFRLAGTCHDIAKISVVSLAFLSLYLSIMVYHGIMTPPPPKKKEHY